MAALMAAMVITGSVSQPLAAAEIPVQGTTSGDQITIFSDQTQGQETAVTEPAAEQGPASGEHTSGEGTSSAGYDAEGFHQPDTEGDGTAEETVSSGESVDAPFAGYDEDGGSAADDESSSSEIGDAPEDTQDYLSALNGSVEITVYRKEGKGFPAGMTAQLILAEELVPGDVPAFERELKAAWADTLHRDYLDAHPGEYTQEQSELIKQDITESIQMFDTYYVKLVDASGDEAEYSDLVFDFHIRDEALYSQVAGEEVSCAAGRYVSGENGYVLAPDNGTLTVVRHDEEKYLTYSLTSGGTGFFTLLAMDNAWEPSGIQWQETNDESEASLEEEEETTEYDTDEEEIDEEDINEEDLNEGISLFASSDYTPSGTRVTSSGTGYTIVSQGDRSYSSAYTPVKAHANSAIIPWNNAGSSVKSGVFLSTSGSYFIPNSKSAAGKFGFRVTNVSYNTSAKCNVDLLMTVSNYDNYTYDGDGKKLSGIYPYFGLHFTTGGYIGFDFDPRLPMMEIKCDFVMTGTNTPVTGNYRLKMLDIDQWQRFGIGMQNGSIAGKYALGGSRVYVGNNTAFGHSYTLFNGDGTSGNGDPLQSVMYELSGTSGIYLLIQLEYRNTQTATTEKVIRRRYEEALKGEVQKHGNLSWDGTAYGATEITTPLKYVSNDGAKLGISNTLQTSGSSYYYTIDHFVPEEGGSYYYNSYKLYDDLPAGVAYDGAWSAVQIESGANVTSWFGNHSSGKHMEFNASASVLSSGNFYGYHYRFTLKVKMVPGEISPVYNGNSAVYTVKNTGHVTVTRSSGASGTKNTNVVTTTATENRISPEAPVKGIDQEQTFIRKKYGPDFRDQDIVFSVFQKVPAEPASWSPGLITMTDILQDVLEFDHCEVYLQKAGAGSFIQDTEWKLNTEGQTLVETRTYDASLAGAAIRWDITCRVKEGADLDAYHQVSEGVTWAVVPNTAKTRLDWSHGAPTGIEQSTNTVTVLFPVSEVNVRVAKSNKDTGENITDAVFTIYEWDGEGYNTVRGDMNYDSVSAQYFMDNLDRTKANEGKYKIVETTTPYGYIGSWEQEVIVPEGDEEEPLEVLFHAENPMSKGTITLIKKSKRKGEPLAGLECEIKANKDVVSPQGKVLVEAGALVDHVTTGEDGKAVSKELYPGEYLVTETKSPLGYALDAEPKVIMVTYQNKDTPVTNVDITFINDRLYGTIELTKEIDAGDIVWAHGNPTFTFKIAGKDVLNVEHTYYDTVEFTRENLDTVSGKVLLKASFKVLAGTYISSEERTMRYSLKDIHDVRGGKVEAGGQSVAFDLSEGGEGAATFYNVKTTDEDEGHTSVVRNVIIGGD